MSTFATPRIKDRALSSRVLLIQSLFSLEEKKTTQVLTENVLFPACLSWSSRYVAIGMDVAASKFYSEKDKTYDLNFKKERVKKAIDEKTCNALVLK
ncbi:enolase 1, partial [Tanacetum coccineum]